LEKGRKRRGKSWGGQGVNCTKGRRAQKTKREKLKALHWQRVKRKVGGAERRRVRKGFWKGEGNGEREWKKKK